jgi:hypothetical protein
MIKIKFKYYIIGLLITNSLAMFSQKTELVNIRKAINVGLDLAGPVSKIFEPGKTDIEMSLSAGSFKNFHFTLEGGLLSFNMNKNDTNKSYKYSSSGQFLRIGFDFNTFKKNLPGENNYILFGLRYGFSSMNHKASNILITDQYWLARNANFSENNIVSQWLEFAGGLRIHLYKNIGAGWTARFKYMIKQGGSGGVIPYYIPGYGKGADNLTVGFTYSIYYTFPIVKEKIE